MVCYELCPVQRCTLKRTKNLANWGTFRFGARFRPTPDGSHWTERKWPTDGMMAELEVWWKHESRGRSDMRRTLIMRGASQVPTWREVTQWDFFFFFFNGLRICANKCHKPSKVSPLGHLGKTSEWHGCRQSGAIQKCLNISSNSWLALAAGLQWLTSMLGLLVLILLFKYPDVNPVIDSNMDTPSPSSLHLSLLACFLESAS